ncbi:hypothetical protein BgiMline_025120, partial [Biomphalaria glabrata]
MTARLFFNNRRQTTAAIPKRKKHAVFVKKKKNSIRISILLISDPRRQHVPVDGVVGDAVQGPK